MALMFLPCSTFVRITGIVTEPATPNMHRSPATGIGCPNAVRVTGGTGHSYRATFTQGIPSRSREPEPCAAFPSRRRGRRVAGFGGSIRASEPRPLRFSQAAFPTGGLAAPSASHAAFALAQNLSRSSSQFPQSRSSRNPQH